MQIKTIRKTIAAKMEDWLSSISDEQLKLDLKKNILVSGGSITSMLLNEDVNDYDIYINNMDVLKRLASYYVDKFGIEVLDGRQSYKDHEDAERLGIRGIALRNLKPDQIKLYIVNGGDRVNEDIKEEDLFYTPKFFSPNAISLSNKIQIVLRFHGDNVAIHKTFDFIHATNYWTFKDGLVTNIAALESILTKQLKYQGSLYPITSIIRMKKFLKRGWKINAGEILKMCMQVSELDLKNPDVLEEQLIGVDVAYFAKLIEVLRGISDMSKMNSAYIIEIIDRVFNDADDEAIDAE